ncbi:piggyBac transposable element-derived protein 4-like [Pecten maximus]|nr:piggyBac transposable element-derived protein 4-like [Pecten maximus]
MDNYFSSPALFYNLWLNGTLACGTLRSNRRGVPDKMKNAHPCKGQMMAFNNGTLVAVKFSDKKEVCLLTTIHEGKMVNTAKRDSEGNLIAKPDCVLDYNHNMGAVDRCDQMVAYAGFDRRTLKWWKKVFFHMLGLAVLNSYILYKQQTANPVLHRIFRRQLVSQLVSAAEISGPQQKGRRRQSAEVLQRLTARHFIGYSPSTGRKAHASRKCIVCGPAETDLFRSQHPGETVPKSCGRMTCFQCKQCQVALCVEPCFELFHTTAEFVLAYKRQRRQEEE